MIKGLKFLSKFNHLLENLIFIRKYNNHMMQKYKMTILFFNFYLTEVESYETKRCVRSNLK